MVILVRTGIEVEALRRLTWRDTPQGVLEWKRPKRKETLRMPIDDPDLKAAVEGFVRRPRRSSDRMDRLVKESKDATGLPELANVSPMTLRLTRCWLLLQEGRSVESVARQLALAPALVQEVAAYPPDGPGPGRRGAPSGADGSPSAGSAPR